MKIYFASDHGGFEMKNALLAFVRDELGHDTEDCGAFTYDADDDYPDFITPCAKKVAADPGSFGIIGGGTGNGEAMAANRVKGARAAVFYGHKEAVATIDIAGTSGSADGMDIIRLAREHNDANMLSLGYRFVSDEEAKRAIKLFLHTPFSNAKRHKRRLAKF